VARDHGDPDPHRLELADHVGGVRLQFVGHGEDAPCLGIPANPEHRAPLGEEPLGVRLQCGRDRVAGGLEEAPATHGYHELSHPGSYAASRMSPEASWARRLDATRSRTLNDGTGDGVLTSLLGGCGQLEG